MSKLSYYLSATKYTFDEDGVLTVFDKTANNIKAFARGHFPRPESGNNHFVDVIFVNGCDYSVPHPIRYRVMHQIEQLRANGISCFVVEKDDVDDDLLRHARCFIIFRCPITDKIREFITAAKKLNKKVIYDIDDLVFDTEYTDLIPFIQEMNEKEKSEYDAGVINMGQTLDMCDAAITTTEELAKELRKHVQSVYVNRNVASDDMLMLSNDAIYRRDILPSLSEEAVPKKDRKKLTLSLERKKEREGVVRIGYFSGSITHNDDYQMILPVLCRVMNERPEVQLTIVGELDLPEQLEPFKERIVALPFCDWKRLPYYIASVDINIAPLRDTVFNRAKSENKWIEASLVKVPTVASDVGAFSFVIENEKTGLLCKTEQDWLDSLCRLIDEPELRHSLAESASLFCLENCISVCTGVGLRDFIQQQQAPNVAMVMPSMKTSGGILVALKHGSILQRHGYDVFYISTDNSIQWREYEETRFPVLNRMVARDEIDKCPFDGWIDTGVATFWDTLYFLRFYPKVSNILYNVQNYEVDFYEAGDGLRGFANATYASPFNDVSYVTISEWCRQWLKSKYGISSRFALNGIDTKTFWPIERDFSNRKIRILVEGDCLSEFKNVDESFRITNQLDPTKYEVWYMTYTNKAKPFYRIDKNLGAVAPDKVADVYRQCDILLKTSILESFSYPPLEMMATGGYVVVVPNEGNIEYLVDGENCLMFQNGNHEKALEAIENISKDPLLRKKLYDNGIKTASSREWENIEQSIVDLYR